jgi:hypothetical protein
VGLFGLPTWLFAGVVLGVLFGGVIATAFLLGERLFPGQNHESPDRTDRGERMRREEIGYYLDSIGESYETDAEVGGYSVAFFLPERDVAVTFDPRAYLALEDSETHSILVEHEMPGVHLGYRLPFETPAVGPETGSERDGTPDGETRRTRGPAFGLGEERRGQEWRRRRQQEREIEGDTVGTSFAVLGLPPDASTEEVRSAYRRRVKEVHPDQGGDEDAFQRVREAYATAREHAD